MLVRWLPLCSIAAALWVTAPCAAGLELARPLVTAPVRTGFPPARVGPSRLLCRFAASAVLRLGVARVFAFGLLAAEGGYPGRVWVAPLAFAAVGTRPLRSLLTPAFLAGLAV